MAYDIGNQLRQLGITDRSDDSVAQSTDKNDTLDFATTHHYFSYSNERQDKETRRVSLPADVNQRRSKFSSWVQHNLPTPPSSRNNSNGSQHSGRSKGRSVSSSSSTFSDPSTPTYASSPTASPTSVHSPPPPVPPHYHPGVPPRSSSLQSDPTTSRSSPPPIATNEYGYHQQQQHDEPTPDLSQHHRSSSTCSSSSTSSNSSKKKRFILPMVPRVRLCQSEKCCKRKHPQIADPPEPPPQLLVTALHHCNQEKINKRKSASQNDLEDHQQQAQQPVESHPPPCYDNQEPPLALTKEGASHLSSAQLPSPHTSSYQRRRRSSCPSKYSATITVQESVMLQSFCSPVHSPHITSSSKHQRQRPRTPTMPSVSSPAPSASTSTVSMQQQDVYDQDRQCLLSFSSMKPRSRPLKRRTSGKKEKKAFRVWHDSLVDAMKDTHSEDTLTSSNRASSTSSMEQQSALSKEKRERNALTRKFILSEFYLTEVTFWNQLYYTKVMFGDPLQKSLERQNSFTRSSDMDIFSNLPDLMQCSSQLIRAMTPFLDQPASSEPLPSLSPSSSISTSTASPRTPDTFDFDHRERPASYTQPTSSPASSTGSFASSSKRSLPVHLNADTRTLPSPNDQLLLGKELCAMASQFVVFLRCALDYRHNRKRLDHRAQHSKGYAVYQKKLALRRETNQFYVHDYLIIPIQRITRYGLLLADLQKHTDRHHPDYQWLGRARMILTALAVAMNKAQQK